MNVTTERWIQIEGSVYTERKFIVKSSITNRNLEEPQHIPIAFNVGKKVADHMVLLQNGDDLTAERV